MWGTFHLNRRVRIVLCHQVMKNCLTLTQTQPPAQMHRCTSLSHRSGFSSKSPNLSPTAWHRKCKLRHPDWKLESLFISNPNIELCIQQVQNVLPTLWISSRFFQMIGKPRNSRHIHVNQYVFYICICNEKILFLTESRSNPGEEWEYNYFITHQNITVLLYFQ